MHRRLNANMKKLATTITDVVQKMNPRVLCMVEVGLAGHPLSEAQMQQVADEAMRAWRDAATEHIELSSMFTAGAPYITIFVCGAFQCSDHRILRKLYDADGRPRTAQAFVLSAPGGDSIDIISVHAPSGTSGTKRLKDPQRLCLLTNLLQSNSMAMPGCTIGQVGFLIGGDMNTRPLRMSQLLRKCMDNGSLRTKVRSYETCFSKHGYLCIAGSIETFVSTSLEGDSQTFDIRWRTYRQGSS